jgi:hypothetical protein
MPKTAPSTNAQRGVDRKMVALHDQWWCAAREKSGATENNLDKALALMPPCPYNKGLTKWVVSTATATTADGKGGSRATLLMKCVECGEWKPRTTVFFKPHIVPTGNDYDAWLTKYINFGCFNNSTGHPCKPCFVAKKRDKRADCELAYASTKAGHYNKDMPEHKITGQQLINRWKQMDACPHTGIPAKYLTMKPHHPLSVSINGTRQRQRGEKYTQNHGDDWEIVWGGCNIRQGDHIESLSYAEMYRHRDLLERYDEQTLAYENARICDTFRTAFSNSPQENGVNVRKRDNQKEYYYQIDHLHLPNILGDRASSHKQADKKANRENEFDSARDLFDAIIAQYGRCAISGMPLTTTNGPYFPSLDRIDNTLGHIKANTRVVCRLLQMPKLHYVMTSKFFVHMMLVQNLVEIHATSREKLEQQHAALSDTCPLCEAGAPLSVYDHEASV